MPVLRSRALAPTQRTEIFWETYSEKVPYAPSEKTSLSVRRSCCWVTYLSG
jgi:hypothetical protein